MTRKIPSAVAQPASLPTASTPLTAQSTMIHARASSSASSNKTIYVVTGANRGIGLELARQLSAHPHAHVIGTTRDAASPSSSALHALPHTTVLQLDVSSSASIVSFGEAVAKLAPQGIDMLWNNAAQNSVKFVVDQEEEIDVEGWVKQLRVNVAGATEVTRSLLPVLKEGKGEAERRVVFIGSTAGSVSRATGKGTGVAYSTSKAALHMSIKFWHNQLAPQGFVVTPIHPGWVKTDMGGDDADITAEESVKGMLKVIAGLKAEDEMKLRVYDGSTLPW